MLKTLQWLAHVGVVLVVIGCAGAGSGHGASSIGRDPNRDGRRES